ncbi:MAG: outer membrane lipoprotein-sorting protein [bacterium]
MTRHAIALAACLLCASAHAQDPTPPAAPEAPAAPAAPAAAERPSIAEVSRKIDNLYRSDRSRGRMTMSIVTPDYERTLTMEIATRGMDDTLMRIESPQKERGVATLKKGNEMWNYLPKIKKTVRVPPSMMMGSWMGSDLTNDDVVRASSWEEDYTAHYTDDGAAPDEWCIEYAPKPSAAVTWSRVVACVERATLLPRRQVFYDEKARPARIMRFTDIKEMDGRTFPTVMTVEPQLKSGHRTTIRYDEIDFDADVPDNTFSLNTLRRGL